MPKFVITKKMYYKGEDKGVYYITPHFSLSKISDSMKKDAFNDRYEANNYMMNFTMYYDYNATISKDNNYKFEYDVIEIN